MLKWEEVKICDSIFKPQKHCEDILRLTSSYLLLAQSKSTAAILISFQSHYRDQRVRCLHTGSIASLLSPTRINKIID